MHLETIELMLMATTESMGLPKSKIGSKHRYLSRLKAFAS